MADEPDALEGTSSTPTTTGAPASEPAVVETTEEQRDQGYADAVISALQPEGSQPSEPEKKPTAEQADPNAETPKPLDADDPTEEELKQLSPSARKRVGQLLGQRKEAREQAEALRQEVEPLKTQAKVAQDLQSYVQATGLTAEDLDAGFSIMAMMRSSPERALAALMPIVQELQGKVGNVLPADLVAEVQDGRITVERALELSRSRAKSAHAEQTLAERTEAARLAEQTRSFQTAVANAATAVSDWERSKSTGDPDWHLKHGRIAEMVELEVRRSGFPASAQAAVQLHQKALDTVNAEFRKFRPAPKPMQMASGHASPNSVTEPKSYLEAAMAGLSAARS